MDYLSSLLQKGRQMEYLIFWGAMGLILLFLTGQGVLADRREKKRFEKKLYESYGKRPDK